jgi:hypothetical protein
MYSNYAAVYYISIKNLQIKPDCKNMFVSFISFVWQNPKIQNPFSLIKIKDGLPKMEKIELFLEVI